MRTLALIALLTVASSALLASCKPFYYSEKPHAEVTMRRGSLRDTELQLQKTVTVRGNIHEPPSPFERAQSFEESDWLYFNESKGVVAASSIVFTHWRSCSKPLYWQKNLEGSIEIGDSDVKIDLYMPRYEGEASTPSKHVPWEHNGVYRLRVTEEAAPPSTEATCGE